MSAIKKKESTKLQTKKREVSDNESEYSSYDERESADESPSTVKSPQPSKTKVEQTNDMESQPPQDATRRRRGGRSVRSRPSRSRSQSRRRGKRSTRSRRR